MPHPVGQRHRLPGRHHHYLIIQRQDPPRVRAQLHRHPASRARFALPTASSRAGNAEKGQIRRQKSWDYQRVRRLRLTDLTCSTRAAYQNLLKKHYYARYTPEKVESVCGTPKEKFPQSRKFASTAGPGAATIPTPRLDAALHRRADHPHRRHDQLLLGNMGMLAAASTPARALQHPGLTDLGLLSNQPAGLT